MNEPSKTFAPSRGFRLYAWIVLAYLLVVILFGAWVRITHSGAGCGSHWPTCHGQIIPFEPSTETLIEYTHRLTSGLLGILGLVQLVWSARVFGRHRVTWAVVVTNVFIVFEALIGAGIVLAELVADDDSAARAIIIAIHLANTLMLTAAATLAAWWSHGYAMPRWSTPSKAKWLLALGLVALVATSMTGAVTALGDTLFPVSPTSDDGLVARVRDDLSATNHFLVRLRILHPIVAVVSSFFLLLVARLGSQLFGARPKALALGRLLMAGVFAQLLVGVLNVALHAPGWLQLLHLLMAQLVWMVTVLLLATVLTPEDDAGGATP